jgi:hypothetical protein
MDIYFVDALLQHEPITREYYGPLYIFIFFPFSFFFIKTQVGYATSKVLVSATTFTAVKCDQL